jgi:hypothetical protein
MTYFDIISVAINENTKNFHHESISFGGGFGQPAHLLTLASGNFLPYQPIPYQPIPSAWPVCQ